MSVELKPPHPCDGTSAPVLTRAVLSSINESEQVDVSRFRLEQPIQAIPEHPASLFGHPVGNRVTKKSASRMDFEFFAGPIDMEWLMAAAKLPGAALNVALAIQHQASLRKEEWVPLSNGDAERFGVKRDAKTRAIVLLEEAGLIEVSSKTGQSPRVRIVGDRCRSRK